MKLNEKQIKRMLERYSNIEATAYALLNSIHTMYCERKTIDEVINQINHHHLDVLDNETFISQDGEFKNPRDMTSAKHLRIVNNVDNPELF